MVIDGVKTEGLVPMADMLNHKRPRQTKWTYVANRNGFVITTLMEVARNNEVFDSYGRKCNSRFFVNYGFVPEINEDNEAILTFLMDESSDLYRTKAQLTNLAPEQAFQIPMQYDDLNNKVKQAFSYVRFLVAEQAEMQAFQERYDSDLRVQETPPVSYDNERRVLSHFAEAANNALRLFPHSLEHDLALLADLESYPYFSNKRNIVLMRSGEKTVLRYYIELNNRIGPALEKGGDVHPELANLPSFLPDTSKQMMDDYWAAIKSRLS